MPNQEQSRDGMPRKDKDNPSPDVAGTAKDDQKSMPRADDSPSAQDYRGDGPARIGVISDDQPDLVAPSGVNERDHGAADDKPMGGGALNFDDGTDETHPRGKVTGTGGTWNEKNPSDAGKLGAPSPGMSDRNGPSDPDAKRSR